MNEPNATERLQAAFFTAPVTDRHNFKARMQAIIAEMFHREPDSTGKPVVWIAHTMGLNQAIADHLKDLGMEVRVISEAREAPRGGKLSWSRAETAGPGEDTRGCPESESRAPSEVPTQERTATGLPEMPVGDPSPKMPATGPGETRCAAPLGISSGITLHIGTVTINL